MVTGSQEKVESIFSGKFGGTNTTQVLMWSILRDKKVNFGVLHISCPELDIEGDICILWGLFAVGAHMKPHAGQSGLTGYNAIRALLSAPLGEYEYHESEECTIDDGFKVRLTDLISLWPNLPEHLEQVMSKRSSLNRIRSVTAESIEAEKATLEQKNKKTVMTRLHNFERNSLHLRAAAFWGSFAVLSCLAFLVYSFK